MSAMTFATAIAILHRATTIVRPHHDTDGQDTLVNHHGWDAGMDDEAPTEPAYQIDDLLFCAADNAEVAVVEVRGARAIRMLDDHRKRYDFIPLIPAL